MLASHTSKTFYFKVQKPLWKNIKAVYGLAALILAGQPVGKHCPQVDNKRVFWNELQMAPFYTEKETGAHITVWKDLWEFRLARFLQSNGQG